eukprot:EC118467.1.p2 GENE.EC118467.1~~EC118467.1.p2  ORF type:complete len:100 (+),score=17.51 EC118467.1:134-433(+)
MKTVLFLAVLCIGLSVAAARGGRRLLVEDDDIREKKGTEWPHLVGQHVEKVKEAILAEFPGLNIIIVPKDLVVTMDYRETRVRLFVDENNIVMRTPRTG